jgi:hypothetical protein
MAIGRGYTIPGRTLKAVAYGPDLGAPTFPCAG